MNNLQYSTVTRYLDNGLHHLMAWIWNVLMDLINLPIMLNGLVEMEQFLFMSEYIQKSIHSKAARVEETLYMRLRFLIMPWGSRTGALFLPLWLHTKRLSPCLAMQKVFF